MKKLLCIVILATLLTSVLRLAPSIQPVNASGTIYIRADGNVDPPSAPVQRNEDVYIFTGDINSDYDGIVIERDSIVLDGAGLTIQGSGNGINLTSISNVTIRNTNIRYFNNAILVGYSSNNSITGNNITNSGDGVVLYNYSNYNSIIANNIKADDYYNTHCGINLYNSCNYNNISGNNITNNDIGLSLASSFNNSIRRNSFDNNGLFMADVSFGNVVSDNLVNGKPLVYLEGVSDIVVGDAGQVVLVQCNLVRVENLNLSTATIGVQLWQTNNTEISENNVTGNSQRGICLHSSSNNSINGNSIGASAWGLSNTYGICLDSSSNNSINGNNVTSNWSGILLDASSEYNRIDGNTITYNSNYGIKFNSSSNNSMDGNNVAANSGGIWLDYSSEYNSIIGNNIANNGGGIRIWGSSNNSIVGNNVTNNSIDGIVFDSSSNYNSIRENTIENNTVGIGPNYERSSIGGIMITSNVAYGTLLLISSNNMFYHNNIITNDQQVSIDPSGRTSVWDNGYPSGGNYWSDHNPLDEDKDKIGDTPYIMDESNTDTYPLIFPFECYRPGYVCSPDLNKDGIVNIVDITMEARAFMCRPGDSKWSPIADMDLNEIINILDVSKVAKEFDLGEAGIDRSYCH